MPINVAIFGCGKTSALHMPVLAELDAFKITGVYDVAAETAKKTAANYNCKSYATYKEALESDDYELAVVLTPSYTHMQITCDLLEHRKKVVATKPWVLSCEQADIVLKTMNRYKGTIIPWLPRHWSHMVKKLRELIDSGRIGTVFQIQHSEYTFGKRDDWQVWREYGGGYLNNWGPHIIGAVVDVAGDSVRQVYADTKQLINPGDTEDMFHALMKTTNGILINAEYTIAAQPHPNWVVKGDKGTIYATGSTIEIHEVRYTQQTSADGYRSDYSIESQLVTVEPSYDTKQIYSHVADVLLGKTVYEITIGQLYHITQIMDAISESARTNSAVDIVPSRRL